jgi:hypothetical protein
MRRRHFAISHSHVGFAGARGRVQTFASSSGRTPRQVPRIVIQSPMMRDRIIIRDVIKSLLWQPLYHASWALNCCSAAALSCEKS